MRRHHRSDDGWFVIEAVMATLVIGIVGLGAALMVRAHTNHETRSRDLETANALIDFFTVRAQTQDCAMESTQRNDDGVDEVGVCGVKDPAVCQVAGLDCDPAVFDREAIECPDDWRAIWRGGTNNPDPEHTQARCGQVGPWRWIIRDYWAVAPSSDSDQSLCPTVSTDTIDRLIYPEREIIINRHNTQIGWGRIAGPALSSRLARAAWQWPVLDPPSPPLHEPLHKPVRWASSSLVDPEAKGGIIVNKDTGCAVLVAEPVAQIRKFERPKNFDGPLPASKFMWRATTTEGLPLIPGWNEAIVIHATTPPSP